MTPGRLIKRENLFFRPDTKLHRKRSNAVLKAHECERKPAELKSTKPNRVVEFGIKHVYLLGNKPYAFAAVDSFKKDAVLRIAAALSGLNSKAALKAAAAHCGKGIVLVNDNGGEAEISGSIRTDRR